MSAIYSEDCSLCDGSGEDPDWSFTDPWPRRYSCPECDGRGRMNYEDVPCRHCGLPSPVLSGIGVKDTICDSCADDELAAREDAETKPTPAREEPGR